VSAETGASTESSPTVRIPVARPQAESQELYIRMGRGLRTWLRAFWIRSYREGITGLSGMVAYNLLLALFPFALLVLFIFGQVLQSTDIEQSVLLDLQRIFPAVELNTLQNALDQIQERSTTIGVAAAIGAIWIGTSFWGAMDTAFCRIYHVECRGWVEQKRFALGMLVVTALFLAATVVIPTLEGAIYSTTDDLPFGLSDLGFLDNLALLAGALGLTFILACSIYYLVPKGHMPWRGIWPGALFVTIAAGIANWLFPVYLVEVSTVNEVGGAIGFILIALIWFYALSLAMLAGAVINALRYELHDTGTLAEGFSAITPDRPCSGD
jgi:YihY family inner membrane protein